MVKETLYTEHPSECPRCRAGGSDRAGPWEECLGASPHMGMAGEEQG